MAAAVEDTTTFADDDYDNNCSFNNNDDDYNNNSNNNNKKKNLEYARRLLYISHFTSQFAEWAWQFSLVIWLAALSDYSSLFLVSIYQATAQLLVLSLVPTLSKMIDSTTTTTSSSTTITSTTATTTTITRNKKQQWNRSQFATYLIAAQNVCVFIATMTIGFTMKRHCQLVPPKISNDNNHDDDDDAISFSRMALIAIICCFGGMAQVLDKTVVVAIERDWIVVMADESKNKTTNKQQQEEDEQQEDEDEVESFSSSTSSSSWLQDTNVTLKQMDLSCQVLGPSISGLVLANYGNRNGNGGFGWVGGCTVVSLITEVLCMKQIYQLVPSLQQQQQQQQQHQNISNNNFSQEESLMAPEKKETITAGNNDNLSLQQEETQQQQRQNASQESSLMALDDDPTHEDRTENNNIQSFSFNNNNNNTVCWDIRKHHQLQVYASQTMAWAGLGLALLYFNVLTFSGMMTAYLVSCGMSKFTIGIWRGISSIVGLLGTFVFSQSQSRLHLDLETTAFWSLIWEFGWLTLSLSSIWVNNDNNNNDNGGSSSTNQNNATLAATLLIAGVLPSRIGLWVYDISVTQLFQQTVAPNVRGQVGGTQMSLNAFFEFLPFVLGMIYSDVNDFWILIVGGYLSVGLAIVLYTFGVYLPYKNAFQAIPKDDEDFPTADGDVQLTER
eukprot:scaffold5684_cov71-Cylindrotheca_fusiformis.AAC.2